MSMLDKPLPVIFPELNSYQIGLIRELMKREYERGKQERIPDGEKMSMYHDLYSGHTKDWTAGFRTGYDIARNLSVSEPTPMNYFPNVDKDKE